jgi:hypothetical protein
MAFWDVYKKDGEKRGDITIGLRCPYWDSLCRHRDKHEKKWFCNNTTLQEDIRREFQEKEQKKKAQEPKKAGPEPDNDEPAKKAA